MIDIVAAPGIRTEDVLCLAAVDQMSSHVLAAAIVEAARAGRTAGSGQGGDRDGG
ncbi:cation transport ATPase [Streptosporangium album]|uniref:Cation transport ATPase n=1 Tax=Streptosporangium album TaxID=47479 RepID=A0A7W7S4C0_9ACTN|nr:hypothetical protein [Streptosporangium album]MBB4943013.1 cation transport ATPase [Streptosporangium album]